MTTTRTLLLILLAAALAYPSLGHANDSSFGGEGASLAPLKETRVRMVSEDIVIERGADRGDVAAMWRVHATYKFENPTRDKVSLQMGFPEAQCDENMDCQGDHNGAFQKLQTVVRGVAVKHRIGTVSKKPSWAPAVGRVFLFDVTFEPRETLEVVHTYLYDRSSHVNDGELVSYVTRTGALWNGPIGRAKFTIRLPERPWSVAFPVGYELRSYVERPTASGGVTEIVFEMKNWTPKRDLRVGMNHWGIPDMAPNAKPLRPCLDADEFANLAKKQGKAAAVARLERLTAAQLRICRNLSYARHGNPFKSKDLRALFYPSVARVEPDEGFGDNKYVMHFTMLENPHYDDSLLSEAERAYIREIKQIEKRRAKRSKR